jgi:predicted TIM-barrel fold metal-dependent hydrolase
MTKNPQRIDLHHHVVAPELEAALSTRGINWAGGTVLPPWSMDMALETMERLGIAAAVASVQPHAYWPQIGEPARWTRYSNEYLAGVVRDDPQHFGGLASLPLPDADAACRELEYALDVLKLDGVQLLTSQGGQYPGDPELEELFQELNKRSAVVVLHPSTAPPFSEQLRVSVPPSLVEMLFDSTRCVANLLYSGTLHRYPAIRFVVPHAGGTIPYVTVRLEMGAHFLPRLREQVPLGALHYLRRLYYDIAISTSELTLSTLRQFVPPSQIVFGSDFSHLHGPLLDRLTQAFDTSPSFDEAAREDINRNNALQLFPRFAAVMV